MHDRPGVGLRNIEDRLARVYGAAGTLRLTSVSGPRNDRGTADAVHAVVADGMPANARLTLR